MPLTQDSAELLRKLAAVLDGRRRQMRQINGARDIEEYLTRGPGRDDEEILTEPLFRDFLEGVLGFPRDGYFEQLSRSGLKPDFTPVDLVAHRFVLDAKSTTQLSLAAHEKQIRDYVDQRRLDYGVLFNLREVQVYRRGAAGHDPELSFPLLPLWQVHQGAALPAAEIARFERFVDVFRHRELDTGARIKRIRNAKPWTELEATGDDLRPDVEFLVDRLRALSVRLADDAAGQNAALERHLTLNPAARDRLHAELRTIAAELVPETRDDELPDTPEGFRDGEGLARRAWAQYLMRVSQLALIRIMLYRSWEDAGFIDQRLYDGGFGDLYDRMGHSVREVLADAFAAGAQRYRWLFEEGAYDWYRPGEEPLVDVLYNLTPVPLGRLDADVLGGLYEAYVVDEVDRDRLGQFYTPRSVVRFMLDRAGFDGPAQVFDVAGDERRPRRIMDFATGSGGFVVEAARRIVEVVEDEGPRGIDEGLTAVVTGIHGCEISPFPYYLTEVNLLLQVSRLLGRMRAAGSDPPRFVLGIVHGDTLAARAGSGQSFDQLAPGERADRAVLEQDARYGLVPLADEKAQAFARMREPDSFDLVIGNPPYVFESNNRVLFERLRQLPGWKGIYRGKTDYLYYFLLLAAERLRPGGRLAVITPAAWMNAGEAEWLREQLASSLRLDELFLFGSQRLFAPERDQRRDHRRAPTPTVESAILIATKGAADKDHKLRVVALEDERAAARALHPEAELAAPERDALLAEMARRAGAKGGRRDGIFVHGVAQASLRHDVPWPVKFGARDLAIRVVKHLESGLDGVEELSERWDVWRGIETAADAYTRRIDKGLADDARRRLAAEGLGIGDRVLELAPGVEQREPWASAPALLARSPEARALLYGAIDDEDYGTLVWIDRGDEVPPAVVAALEPWKPLLAARAEIKRNVKRRWYETAWARDKVKLRGPKVIALYRAARGRFALDESGDWQPSNKSTVCIPRTDDLSAAYLCGLLNSELLDLWFAVRGKTPWHVRRNYEPKHMRRIPYRHVAPLPAEDPRSARAARAEGDPPAVLDLADEALAAVAGDPGEAPFAARALEAVVRAVAANRRLLLPHRGQAPLLRRVVKDPWCTSVPPLDPAEVIGSLPRRERVSLRLDPALTLAGTADGPVGRAGRQGEHLVFLHRRQETVRVSGPTDRLDLLEALVAARGRLLPAELEAVELPVDLAAYRAEVARREAQLEQLLVEGRDLVERAERLVCRLFGCDPELEDEVIARAAERAAATLVSDAIDEGEV